MLANNIASFYLLYIICSCLVILIRMYLMHGYLYFLVLFYGKNYGYNFLFLIVFYFEPVLYLGYFTSKSRGIRKINIYILW